jgi:Kef-type K+ transport system membrane component KefB
MMMDSNATDLITPMFYIFAGAAVTSTVALFTRQSMMVAYMLIGIVFGPYCLKYVGNVDQMRHIGDLGIMFLLFLLGLNLPPQKLMNMLKKISMVGVLSSIVFLLFGFLVSFAFGFGSIDSLIIGASMMFSSTIIGIKLLPTTILHHQHTGEVMISILLFQDIIAILVLLSIRLLGAVTVTKSVVGAAYWGVILKMLLGFPVLIILAFVLERYFLMWLLRKFSRVKEYLFLISIAWCLSLSALAVMVNLPFEIGAFVAGVSLATSPISVYIAESLKPVRDFFLVLFFFSVGALFDLSYLNQVYVAAIFLAVGLFFLKPLVYRFLLGRVGEQPKDSWEVGARLGQVSEFSLIIAVLANNSHFGFDLRSVYLIKATTMISFILSSYWVVMKYPTPVSFSSKMRRD